MKLRTVIIDDERDSIRLLELQLAQNCPEVEVIAVFNGSAKALNDLEDLKPDLLFIDVEMPLLNGFELLNKLLHITFSVVFITAYNQYALKAFRFNALDYLVKPVEPAELMEAVAKAGLKRSPTSLQLNLSHRQMRGEIATKIAISGQNGISFIELNQIVFQKQQIIIHNWF